jgi:hypothetical protein
VSTGTVSLAYSFRAIECLGGWNVHGFDDDEVLVFECLHSHPSRHVALLCAIECDKEAMRERGENDSGAAEA